INTYVNVTNLTQAYYDDGAVAAYTYRNSNVADNTFSTVLAKLVETCDDPRYAGPMKRIKYEYVPHYGSNTGAGGQLKAERNATTNERYSGPGAIKKITHPGDQTTVEFTYSDLANPYYMTGRKDENDHWTYFDRDGNHRITQTRYPNGAYETFSYNGFGQVVDHRLTSGGVEHFDYDYRGLKTACTDPLGNVTHYNYYQNGPNTDRLYQVVD